MSSHEACRAKVCIQCLRKTSLRVISETLRNLIQCNYLSDLEVRNWFYPTKICANCAAQLYTNGPINVHQYKDIPRTTRANHVCECDICTTARRTLPNLVPGGYSVKKRGRPTNKTESDDAQVEKLCKFCYGKIGKGIRHICSKTSRHANVLKIVQNKDGKIAGDSVVAAFLRQRQNEGDNSISLSNLRGHPTTVSLNQTQRPTTAFASMDDLSLISNKCNMSMRAMLNLSSILRGLNVDIPQHLPEKLKKINHYFDEYFDLKEVEFEVESGQKGTSKTALKPVIFCNNVPKFIEQIKIKRNLSSNNSFIKVGIDGGGVFSYWES